MATTMRLLLLMMLQAWAAAANDKRFHFPGAPAHSTVLVEGGVATYACERGFELLGPSRRTLGHDGQWTPDGIPFCVLNVAAGKAPMQVSTEMGAVPQRAVDGSTSSFFSADTCTLTRPERAPWWYVNLLEPYMVQLVRLDLGRVEPQEQTEVVVRVGNNRPDLGANPVCNRFSGAVDEGQPLFLPCNPPMAGAFVSVHLEPGRGSRRLSLCEAFVYTDQALPIERCPHFRDQPPGSTATYNGNCYVFYARHPLAFDEARAFCEKRGGTLVVDSNPALQGFISWELWRRHRSDTSSQYWIGARRERKEKTWRWVNGEEVRVSFWSVEPEMGGEGECARYDGTKGWLWSETDCRAPLNFICQHQPKACGRPEQPPNSTMIAPNFDVGANVEYSCDPGHLLVGPTTRTCLDTGFYNDFPPVCKRIECGYPADIPNGGYQLINGSVGYLSHVVYTCEEGYEIIGRSKLTCDIDERWNGPPPRCEAIQCEPPPQIANGKYASNVNDTSFGSAIEYFCLRGYTLHGSKRAVCLASGQWDNAPPTCKLDENWIDSAEEVRTTAAATTTSRTTTRRPTRLPTQQPEEKRRPQPEDSRKSGSSQVPHIIVASHPQEKPAISSGGGLERASLPTADSVDRRDPLTARLNLGAIIALAAFGSFVFLAAIVTTVVILVRRKRVRKHYRHRVSADCKTVASLESSSSESRNGLNRYYRQAWENLHESAGSKAALKANLKYHQHQHQHHRRLSGEGVRDGSELVVSDVALRDKRRHHHHHHHPHHHSNRY